MDEGIQLDPVETSKKIYLFRGVQMDFKPIKTKKIYQEVVEQIKDLIVAGTLNPGDKLISERELAERLDVGRSAIREAFRSLETMGLIEIRPGEGTFVREASVQKIIEPLAMVMLMEKKHNGDILEIRKIIEVGTAGLAAERRTEEELEQIQLAFEQMAKDVQEGVLGEETDLKFHQAIAEAAHNPLLARLLYTVGDSMQQAMKIARTKFFATIGNHDSLLEGHRNIYEAIKAGDSRKASEAMLNHLIHVENEMAEDI